MLSFYHTSFSEEGYSPCLIIGSDRFTTIMMTSYTQHKPSQVYPQKSVHLKSDPHKYGHLKSEPHKNMSVSLSLMCGQIGAMIGNLIFPILLEIDCIVPFALIGSLIIGDKEYLKKHLLMLQFDTFSDTPVCPPLEKNTPAALTVALGTQIHETLSCEILISAQETGVGSSSHHLITPGILNHHSQSPDVDKCVIRSCGDSQYVPEYLVLGDLKLAQNFWSHITPIFTDVDKYRKDCTPIKDNFCFGIQQIALEQSAVLDKDPHRTFLRVLDVSAYPLAGIAGQGTSSGSPLGNSGQLGLKGWGGSLRRREEEKYRRFLEIEGGVDVCLEAELLTFS
ncbi:unnamed protein product [Timema podura]|uniref:Uncharacterized protein n=1 Tax=Timema podura TaxID=61482 RepID=A0ABN7NQ79_TIMPD|nr:unnamed protein product [Timema podura]